MRGTDHRPLAERLAEMIDVPSTTGSEGAYADLVAGQLSARGFEVRRQAVAPGRDNLLAVRGRPRVLFSTHLDTVPPHLPSGRRGDEILGRGACDAKGCLAAMFEAAGRLEAREAEMVGFLLVVGEEVDHAGAIAARELEVRPEAILLGEPTGNLMARAQKGMLRIRLRAEGVAGHSGYPELGPSAVHRLVAALGKVLEAPWPEDPRRGRTSVNVGRIEGGVAGNVIAGAASAEVVFRLVGDPEAVVRGVRERLGEGVELEFVTAKPPLDLAVLDGFATTVVAFYTDADYLSALGPVFLMGPGDIRTAHSPGERIGIHELERGAELYASAARKILRER